MQVILTYLPIPIDHSLDNLDRLLLDFIIFPMRLDERIIVEYIFFTPLSINISTIPRIFTRKKEKRKIIIFIKLSPSSTSTNVPILIRTTMNRRRARNWTKQFQLSRDDETLNPRCEKGTEKMRRLIGRDHASGREERRPKQNSLRRSIVKWPWRISCNWKRRSPPFQIAGNVVKACLEIEHEKRVELSFGFHFHR